MYRTLLYLIITLGVGLLVGQYLLIDNKNTQEIISLIFSVLILFGSALVITPRRAAVSLVVIALLVLGVAVVMATTNKILHTPVLIPLFLLAAVYVEHLHQKEWLSKFVPNSVAKQLLENDGSTTKGKSIQKDVVIMFCDIQEFTSLSEKVEPSELVFMVNKFFEYMTEVLEKHNATLDKYMGDCIMSFWGAPKYQVDAADRAIRCAFEMKQKLIHLNRLYRSENLPPIKIGIGIHSGKAAVGLMGSKAKMSYTIIGAAVNTCARLEAQTRKYQTDILVSSAVLNSTNEYRNPKLYEELDTIQVRGSSEVIHIFALNNDALSSTIQ